MIDLDGQAELSILQYLLTIRCELEYFWIILFAESMKRK